MSIGGNPSTPGSITLDDTVEHAQWKSSLNASPQEVTKIVLNGGQIWEKPDLQIVQNNLSYNTATELLTVSVTRPPLINSWKYKINNGSLSSKQTSNTITIGISNLNNGADNTITVYGYRDDVLKGNPVAKTIFVEQDTTITPSISWDASSEEATLSVTLGGSLTKWSYENLTDGGGEKFVVSGTTATINTANLSTGTKNIRVRGYVGSTHKSDSDVSFDVSYDISVDLSVTSETNASGHVLLSVTSPHIDSWKYQIGSGQLSSSQSGTSIEIPFSQFNNLTNTTVTVKGYRASVQRAEDTDTILLVKHGIVVENVITLADTLDLEMIIAPVDITSQSRWEYKIDEGPWERGGPIFGGAHDGYYRLASPVSENQSPIQLPGGEHTVYVRYVGVRDGTEYVHFTTGGNAFTSVGPETEIVTEASELLYTEDQLSVIADGIIQGNARAGEISYSDEWLEEADAFPLADVKSQFSSFDRDEFDCDNITIYRFDLRKLGVTYYPGLPMQVQMGYGFNHIGATNEIYQIPWISRIGAGIGIHNEYSLLAGGSNNMYPYRDYKYKAQGELLAQELSGYKCKDSRSNGLNTGHVSIGHALTHQSSRRRWIDQIFPDGIPGEAQGVDYFQIAESACLENNYQPRGLLSNAKISTNGSALPYPTFTQPGFDGWDGNLFCNIIKPVQGNAWEDSAYFNNKMGTPNSGLIHTQHVNIGSNHGVEPFYGSLVQAGPQMAWTNDTKKMRIASDGILTALSGILYRYFDEPFEHQWGCIGSDSQSFFELENYPGTGDKNQHPEFAGHYFYIAQYTGENTTFYHTPRIRINKEHMWGEGEGFDNDVIYNASVNLSSADQAKFENIPNSYRLNRPQSEHSGELFPVPIFPTYKIYFDKYNEYASWSHTLFCPLYYLNNNADLLSVYGKRNIAAATQHFLEYGINEAGRDGTYGPFEYNRETNPYGTVTLPGPTASNDDFSTTLLDVRTQDLTTDRAPRLLHAMKAPGRYQTGARGKEYHVIKGYDANGAVVHKEIINI
jgi:hypothetical protein